MATTKVYAKSKKTAAETVHTFEGVRAKHVTLLKGKGIGHGLKPYRVRF